jgi:hypothetical protein
MGVYESSAKMKLSAKNTKALWEQTRAFWKDEKSRQFEEQFLTRLFAEIEKVETALDTIGAMLNRIRVELRE